MTKGDCKHGGWRDYGFHNIWHCFALVKALPSDGDNGHGHGHGHGGWNGDDDHGFKHRLISTVRPESSGGNAMLALGVGFGLFVLGMVLPVRRRLS